MTVKEQIDELRLALGDDYSVVDISEEDYRMIITKDFEYRIDEPVILITQKGCLTHRVIDVFGQNHCYASPETGNSVVVWKSTADN